MFCISCSSKIPQGARFCPNCAQPVDGYHPRPDQNRRGSRSPTLGNILTAFVIVGLLLVGAAVAGKMFGLDRALSSGGGAADIGLPEPLAQPHTIVNQTFNVSALGYSYFPFQLPRAGKLKGNFTAYNGKNDIEVVVFDEAGFQNFKNGNRARRVFYYSGGYVTTDDIDRDIPAGSYYLVFNNKDAIFTGKVVTASIDAVY